MRFYFIVDKMFFHANKLEFFTQFLKQIEMFELDILKADIIPYSFIFISSYLFAENIAV